MTHCVLCTLTEVPAGDGIDEGVAATGDEDESLSNHLEEGGIELHHRTGLLVVRRVLPHLVQGGISGDVVGRPAYDKDHCDCQR